MDFRLLGRGRLNGFSNSLISNAVSVKIDSLYWLLE